ncbi:hypothetical protein Tco_0857191 [Tanacetum coccineum]|uniref:Uncharacterized protein n=1 Tax=Tanacetum coccineum TaxID=301880 RepID=A0ABQ5BB63_9ASTR
MLTPTCEDFCPSVERHAYCDKLSKLQEMSFGVPRVANRRLFDGYGFEDTLREMMKLKYIYEGDGDVFVDYSWERALGLIMEIFYPEGCRKFFSILYFDKDVDRNNFMKEKCIWFRLCGHEHILTLPKFAVVLGLFIEEEVEQVYFGKLEVDDKQFDYKDYWTRVGNQGNQEGHYGLGGDDYFTSAMPDFRGVYETNRGDMEVTLHMLDQLEAKGKSNAQVVRSNDQGVQLSYEVTKGFSWCASWLGGDKEVMEVLSKVVGMVVNHGEGCLLGLGLV